MQRKTASDFDPAVMKLFDQYVHGIIDRRGFLNGATRYAVGGVSAAMLLDALSPRFAQAQVIAMDDRRIVTKMVEVPSPAGNGKIRGLLAMPANLRGKLPAVLVVHENRGLNPHIEDIARRLAVENFIAFAPDALTPLGGYPGDEDKARDNFAKLDRVKMDNDFIASTNYLKSLPESNGKFGATGFCFGGAVSTCWPRVSPIWARQSLFMADNRQRRRPSRSSHPCCCITRATIAGSIPAGRRSRSVSRRPACAMRPISTHR